MTVRPAARSHRTISWRRSISFADRLAGGLVEDDEIGLARERAQDLDLLLLGDAAGGRRRPAVEVEAGVGGQPVEPLGAARRRSMNPARRGSAPRKTFWATVSRGTRATSWATIAMPRSSAWRGEPNATGRPPQDQVALVLREDAGDDLAQRRLAGAVLADERVDGAGPDLDRDVVQGPGRPEGLPEPADLEVDRRGRPSLVHRPVSRPWSGLSPATPRAARKVSTLAWVTTPPSGSESSGSMPGAGVPVRMAWMSCSVPRPPSVAGICMTVP